MGGGGGSANLNPELYTEKAWEAVTRLPALADENGAQMVETELLLKSLLNEGPQGLASRILYKAGADTAGLESELDKYIANQPRVSNVSNKVTPLHTFLRTSEHCMQCTMLIAYCCSSEPAFAHTDTACCLLLPVLLLN
eukprot:5668-Heterococcus_DN1.PRE.1